MQFEVAMSTYKIFFSSVEGYKKYVTDALKKSNSSRGIHKVSQRGTKQGVYCLFEGLFIIKISLELLEAKSNFET